jgi:acyl carrier protein
MNSIDNPIYDDLSKFIADHILKQPQREIAPNEALISVGLIDSFNLVDLALYVEDTFGVRIDDTELTSDNFDTLNQLVAIIRERQS